MINKFSAIKPYISATFYERKCALWLSLYLTFFISVRNGYMNDYVLSVKIQSGSITILRCENK